MKSDGQRTKRIHDKVDATPSRLPSGPTWSKGRKWLVSVLVLMHLGAVISAPCANPPPSSLLAQNVAWFFSDYQYFAFLNHGYRFFAPDPGPSHIVRYEVDTEAGKTVKGQFPDRHAHWPRLLYHRHFMISETVYRVELPFAEDLPKDVVLEGEQKRAYDEAMALAVSLRKSIARELIEHHNGERVRLFLVEHMITEPNDIVAGVKLDDPRSYVELTKLAEFSKDEL